MSGVNIAIGAFLIMALIGISVAFISAMGTVAGFSDLPEEEK